MRLPEQLILEQCTVQEVFDATAKLLPPHNMPTIHEFEYFSKKLSRCIGVRLPVEPVAATAGSFNLPEFQSKKLRNSLQELEDGAANASEDQRPRFQLLLADCCLQELKGAAFDPERAMKLYFKAAQAGDPAACIVMAQNAYTSLLGGDYSEGHPPVPCIARTAVEYADLEEMWFWLEAAVERGLICPFFLTRAQEARRTGSWKLSKRTLKILKERDADVQRQTARTMAQPSVGCARAGCDIRVNSASQLKKCGRCRAVAYCSVWCQKIDWRARHKAVCTPFNGAASVTTSDATESGKEQSKNLLHGGVLFTSSTVNADFLTGFGSLWATDREKVIQNADHYPEQPRVEHGELMRQARDLMARRQFLAAKRCLNRAADDLWISGLSRESTEANEKRRDMLVPIMCLSAKCRLALSEKHMSVSDVDRALEDVELLLSGSIFPLEGIKPDTLADLRNMEKQAKLQKARLSYDLPVRATQSVTRSTNNSKKKKKKQATKKDEPALVVTLTEKLLSQEVAKNASSSDDGCTICLTGWADFATITLAVVPPCQHPTCAPCLSRFHKSCKTSFESDTSLSCTLCRAAFPDSLVTTAAHVSVQSNLVPAFKELPQHLGVSDPDDRHRLLTSLLTVHNFDLPQVTDILFSMVGVVTTTAVRDLTHDDKERIYEEAREPVRRLAGEHRQLRAKLARSYETDHPEWRATLARARDVAESLEQARENAAAHIYERVNAAGKMGRAAPNGRAPVHVDLHGLHEDEARRTLIDFVFPTLPVLKMVNVITGKGTHSQDGEGVLRGLVKTLTVEHGFRVEKNKNSGVLTLRA